MKYPVLPLKARPADDVVLFGPEASVMHVAELQVKSDELAGLIRQIWPKESHAPTILINSSNPFVFIQGLVGCYKAGAVAVCWSEEKLSLEEVSELVGAEGLIDSDSAGIARLQSLGQASWLEHPPGNLIMMTSGSTGRSKGVSLDLEAVVMNATLAGNAIELRSASCRYWAFDIDFSMMSALNHFIMAWQNSLPVYYLRGMDQNKKNEVLGEQKIGYGGAPLQMKRLLETAKSNQGPAVLVSSGDFLLPSISNALRESFTETKIHSFYGLTEVSGRFCVLNDRNMRLSPTRTGAPLPGFGLRVSGDQVEEKKGEIELRTPLLFRGYYHFGHRFEKKEPGLWFPTGDIGEIRDGFITLLGRSNDVFKVSGIKVDRHTIESCLAEIMYGIDFCVLPVEHKLIGQCPALFVITTSGSRPPAWVDIVKHIKSKLSSHHIPMYGYSLSSFPRLLNGKLDKQKLIKNRESYEEIK